jgi:glutathione S-transferase
MKLYIGNKKYSSWSMRPWVLMREKGIAFDEVMLRFDHFQPDSKFKQAITAVSPAGRVPALVDDDGLLVWDTLAIAEYLAERFPDRALWPTGRAARARARSVCAEMHSGFGALRSTFPMNIEAALPEVGARMLAEKPEAAADLARIATLWTEALNASGGPFLFGDYGIADAYFAPVAARVRSYALPLPPAAAAYVERLWATAGVQAWVAEALQEADFVPEDEPYRTHR